MADDYNRRKEMCREIASLSRPELEELYRILRREGGEFSENSNGIFFDVAGLPANAFEALWKFIEFCKSNASELEKRNADIDNGTLKLRIPVQAPVCPVHTASDAPATPRDSVQATAELDRETAKNLIAITDDGDKAIRQLNACIDAYNTVYQTLNKSR